MSEYPVLGPREFASETPPARVMASETEYLLSARELSAFLLATRLVAMTTSGPLGTVVTGTGISAHSSSFLRNGSRVYKDCNNYVEVAAAEGLGPRQAAEVEYANQLLLTDNCATLAASVSEKESFQLYRRTGFMHTLRTESSGYHINLLTPLASTIEQRKRDNRFMGTQIAMAAAILGTGAVGRRGYCLRQKYENISLLYDYALPLSGFGSRTGASKPILTWSIVGSSSTGGMQAHAKNHDRLEIRLADAPHSLWGRIMGFGMPSLALRLTEHEKQMPKDFFQNMTLSGITRAVHESATDLSLKTQYKTLADKDTYVTALDWNKMCAEQILTLSEKVKLPEDELWVANEWLRVTEDLGYVDFNEPDSLLPLRDRLDMAIRYIMLCRAVGSTVITTKDDNAVHKDLMWDQIFPNAIADKYWSKQQSGLYAASEENIRYLRDHPPAETRASARVATLEPYYGQQIAAVDWNYIKPNNYTTLELNNPYDPTPVTIKGKRAKVVAPRSSEENEVIRPYS